MGLAGFEPATNWLRASAFLSAALPCFAVLYALELQALNEFIFKVNLNFFKFPKKLAKNLKR